jgi:hypothetical protein
VSGIRLRRLVCLCKLTVEAVSILVEDNGYNCWKIDSWLQMYPSVASGNISLGMLATLSAVGLLVIWHRI